MLDILNLLKKYAPRYSVEIIVEKINFHELIWYNRKKTHRSPGVSPFELKKKPFTLTLWQYT
jgi:hypothetical protein